MGELSPWHLLILAAVFVVLFGSRKLPDAARSLVRSMRIFRAETKALHDGEEGAEDVRTAQPVAQPVLQQPASAAPHPVPQPTPVQARLDDGTIVHGGPLADAPRQQQPNLPPR